MLPKVNVSEMTGTRLRNSRKSCMVMLDGEVIGIFINPQTDYIKQSALNFAELSNTVVPKDYEDALKEMPKDEPVEV